MFGGVKRLVLGCTIALGLTAPAYAADPCADYTPQAKPQNASRDIVGQDIIAIVEDGLNAGQLEQGQRTTGAGSNRYPAIPARFADQIDDVSL